MNLHDIQAQTFENFLRQRHQGIEFNFISPTRIEFRWLDINMGPEQHGGWNSLTASDIEYYQNEYQTWFNNITPNVVFSDTIT